MRELHLFAGAGGGILGGMLLGHVPVCAVEIDKYCRRVLQARQDDGSLPPFPIYEDVREFDGTAWRGLVEVVAGGFPCQPFSCAGKQLGTSDPRHLWPEMARIIEEVRPRYVFAENVSISAFEEPWRDLRRLGYRVPPALCVSASDVGAPHLRKRWWLLATDTNGTAVRDNEQRQASRRLDVQASRKTQSGDNGETGQVADAESQPKRSRLREGQQAGIGRRRSSHSSNARQELAAIIGAGWWATQPDVGRVAHGLASRVDRLKALGNGQVPLTAATAWRLLMEANA